MEHHDTLDASRLFFNRLGEKIGVLLTPVLKPLMLGSLKKYSPVQANKVAEFMVEVAHEEPVSGGVHVYESDMIG